jgi:hypothetical protein
LELLSRPLPGAAKAGRWASLALALVALITVIHVYPNYFPYINALGAGSPGYHLVNDSNLDWNHALPEVESFVLQRQLKHVLLDEYGFSEPTVYIPQAEFWNCQTPASSDSGQWAVVSANMIEDGHNCRWLMRYPHATLAAGSMYAFELPMAIPAAGTAGGPPLPDAFRNFAGFPGDEDARLTFLRCIRDPQQLQPTMDRITAMMQAYAKKK